MSKTGKGMWSSLFLILICASFMLGGVGMLVKLALMLLGDGADYRWIYIRHMLIPTTICIAIVGGIIAGLMAYRRSEQNKNQLKQAHPDQPWMWQKDWAAGVIKCSSKTINWVMGGFALLWNLCTLPMIIGARDQIFDPANRQALIALLFPAVGLLLIILWLFRLLRYKRFGDSYFQMGSVPGVIGGKLGGVVHISKHIESAKGFRVILSCIRTEMSGSGKDRKSHKRVTYQDELSIARELLASDYSRTAIPILFAIPYHSQATGEYGPDVSVHWALTVSANVPGLDYEARFIVPVFKTTESRADFELDESPLAGSVAETDPEDMLKEHRIKHAVNSDQETFVCPLFRNFGVAMSMGAFSAIWFSVVFFMFNVPSLPWPMAVIFALFGLLAWHMTLDLFLWTSKVELLRDGIRVRYGFFGLNQCELPYESIGNVKVESGIQSGETLFHNVVLSVNRGRKKKVPLIKRIRNRRAAKMLTVMIERSIAETGRGFESRREQRAGKQYWRLWKERLLWWSFVGMLAALFTFLRLGPTGLIWQ